MHSWSKIQGLQQTMVPLAKLLVGLAGALQLQAWHTHGHITTSMCSMRPAQQVQQTAGQQRHLHLQPQQQGSKCSPRCSCCSGRMSCSASSAWLAYSSIPSSPHMAKWDLQPPRISSYLVLLHHSQIHLQLEQQHPLQHALLHLQTPLAHLLQGLLTYRALLALGAAEEGWHEGHSC
jgi:hypothetical protein